jgi:hypothetical protein
MNHGDIESTQRIDETNEKCDENAKVEADINEFVDKLVEEELFWQQLEESIEWG